MPDGIATRKPGYILGSEDHSAPKEVVLLVDDDQDILGLAAEILETLGYDVVTANTGLQALAILRDNLRISILLTDIQMPGMGGEELAGIAATSRPDLRVVFASGSIRPSADAAFLQKPYKTADLVGLLPPVR
jgi:two-component system, cell cycle response regulator CpdR